MGKTDSKTGAGAAMRKPRLFAQPLVLLLTMLVVMGPVIIYSHDQAAALTTLSWFEQHSGTTSTLLDLDAVDRNVIWVCGKNSTIRATTDGGASWLNRQSGLPSPYMQISRVAAIDAQTAWAYYGTAEVLRTTNAGVTWEGKALPAGVSGAEAFDAPSASTAWAAGAAGTISKTSNGGNTWEAQASGTANALYAFDAVDEITAWTGGAQGTILKTSDSGAHWVPQSYGMAYDIMKLRAVDANTAWALVGSAGLIKTTDGGNTWVVVQPRSGLWNSGILDISPLDANTVWVITKFSQGYHFLFRSCDGGITWEKQYTTNEIANNELNAVACADARNAWVAGGSGLILNTVRGGGKTWYLAEGCTEGGMETWILVQNPNAVPGLINIDFVTDKGPAGGPQGEVIPPYSRKTFFVGSYVRSFDVSTEITVLEGMVLCERAMYGNGRSWGHDSIATDELSSTWYLAEGCTAGGMETWILVQNPNDFPVDVELDFMTERGEVQGPNRSIPANTRSTFNVGEHVVSYDVSTRIKSIPGEVICERAMYGNNHAWAHDSIGAQWLSQSWMLAEGCTADGMETYILVQNPLEDPAHVSIRFNTDSGPMEPPSLQNVEIAPLSRKTFRANEFVTTHNVSTLVRSTDGYIVCERAMYGRGCVWAHASIGATYASYAWFLTEGSTSGGMETWVLVQNPGDVPVHVSLSLMTDSGRQDPAGLQNVEIAAGSRVSFPIHAYVQTYDVSTRVFSEGGGVVCERAVYGGNRTWGHDSIGSIVR